MSPDDLLEVAREKLARGLSSLGAEAGITQAIAPVLSYLLGVEEARPRDLDPEQLKRQIVLAARLLVERRLEQGPLLVIVDDFHWADAASVDLLRGLADHLADRRLMMLVAHRPEVRPPVRTGAEQTEIRLAALSADETRQFVDGLFGSLQQPGFARLRDLIVARAGGNPLFVEEIVRSLVGRGVLVREAGHWMLSASVETVSLPPTLHGLLLSRVDKLPADTRRVLQAAAVLGVSFDEVLLQAVAGDAAMALERLVEADLMRDAGQGHAGEGPGPLQARGRRYRFTHALVHEVVYENLLLSRRSELHERAGRALEEAVGPLPSRLSDLEALGHHWSFTSDKARGARYLTAAGDRSRAVYANDDAIRHYERALATLASCLACDDQIRIVRERLADLLALTGKRADALAHYEAVRQELEAAGDGAGAARLYRKIGGLHWETGDRERARACFAAGIDRLGEAGDPIERASSSTRRSVAWPFAPATMRAPSPGPSGRLPRRRGRTRRLPTASASARGRRRRRRPTTRWAWRSRGRASPGRRSTGSSRASRWPRATISCRRPAAATPTSACSRARSIRRAASRPACAASRSPGRSAISPSSRGCMPTWRWPIARSPIAARRRASRRRKPPSTSTAGWA